VALFFAVVVLVACVDLFTEPFEYGQVEVVAVRRSGEPVAGVKVTAFTGARILGTGVTDEEGRFVFGYLPHGAMGVLAEPPEGYRPLDLLNGFVVTDSLEEGAKERFEFTYLKFGTGALVVAVEEQRGNPVVGLRLQLNSSRGPITEAVTGPDGTHTFDDLQLDSYSVFAFPKGAYTFADGRPLGIVDNLLVEDGIREAIEFELDHCFGGMRVRAADTSGAAIRALKLQLYTAEAALTSGATNEQGILDLGEVDCGVYGIQIERTPGIIPVAGPSAWFVDGVRVGRGEQPLVQLSFVRCNARFRARVNDTSGLPVVGARVVLYTPLGNFGEGSTDSGGRYDLGVVPCHDQYGVAVKPPAGYSVNEGPGQSFFDGIVLGSGTDREVTFTLRRS
jgi:hypothetical protein